MEQYLVAAMQGPLFYDLSTLIWASISILLVLLLYGLNQLLQLTESVAPMISSWLAALNWGGFFVRHYFISQTEPYIRARRHI